MSSSLVPSFSSLKNINMKFWKRSNHLNISDYDPTYKVIYLGNVLTPWAKGDACVEKPLATLWKNYCGNVKREIYMKLTICNSGLKALTREHGLTEYWSNRVTYCVSHPSYPKVFCWVYRHEGRKMKQELRCHAVLCTKDSKAKDMADILSLRLTSALAEFRREKRMRQNSKVCLASGCKALTSQLSVRKRHLVKGQANFRAPLERSRSAPKLHCIDESREEEEREQEAEDEAEMAAYFKTLHHKMQLIQGLAKGGSLSSEGQDTVSDIAFSEDQDVDSLSEAMQGLSSSGGSRGSSSTPSEEDMTLVRCDPRTLDSRLGGSSLNAISEDQDTEDERTLVAGDSDNDDLCLWTCLQEAEKKSLQGGRQCPSDGRVELVTT